MTERAYMLIHQLSSACWGTMAEFRDEMKNLEELMKIIKNIYKEHTRIPPEDLEDILSHDLWWNAKKCKRMGLIDKIIKENTKMAVNETSPF